MLGLENITKLSESFQKEEASSRDSYIQSLPYYLLTGRKGAKVYSKNGTHVVVCKHPHIEDRLLVFPEINGNGSLTAQVLDFIDIPKNGIQLARYSKQDLAQLQQVYEGHNHGHNIEVVPMEETAMDWKYPVRILDTQRTAAMTGKEYDKLRNKFNKAASDLTILPLDDFKALPAMRASLMFWAGAMIYAGKDAGCDLTEFYNTLFNLIRDYPALFDGFVVLHRGEPAGFTIWDKPTNGTCNALAGLSRKSVKGMSEFQTVTACRILEDQNVQFYNMGGSESEGLDKHKLEYRPSKSFEIGSYELSLKHNGEETIQVQDLTP